MVAGAVDSQFIETKDAGVVVRAVVAAPQYRKVVRGVLDARGPKVGSSRLSGRGNMSSDFAVLYLGRGFQAAMNLCLGHRFLKGQHKFIRRLIQQGLDQLRRQGIALRGG